MIVFDKRSPVYEQIIAYFKAEIASHRMEAGQEMPSRREFAQTMQVNPNTVQRAFHELEVMGLITTGNNVMSRVTEDVERIEQLKDEMLDEAIGNFTEAIKPLNLTAEDVIEHLKKQL
ncbi:GntR family transcriptional regulator [Streptococcus sp. 263_SSPC]|uniref:GntR family transcriptional regulator n=1 Tax=Streptococcus sp. 263_SSPC TaxID=1579343 RepID=UPI000660A186|nr:GntR family transcriptional regulator [Streptococcus sp. 263_SSPC]